MFGYLKWYWKSLDGFYLPLLNVISKDEESIEAFCHAWGAKKKETISSLAQSCSQSLRSPWPGVRNPEFWEQPFQTSAIGADCTVKPYGQNSVICFSFLFQNGCSTSLAFRVQVKGNEDSGNEIEACPLDNLLCMGYYWPNVTSRWLAKFSFCVFMDWDEVEFQKLSEKEWGQDPAILSEQT